VLSYFSLDKGPLFPEDLKRIFSTFAIPRLSSLGLKETLLDEDRMTKPPITIKPDDSFQGAFNLLRQWGCSTPPLPGGRKLVVIPTGRDVIKG
jgi:hypothetical protein